MRYRNRARVASRFSAQPIVLIAVLVLAVVAAGYVGIRMALAPRPQVELAGPFEVVGRNLPLVVRASDPGGLRALKVVVLQGDEERVVADETYEPPRKQAEVRWLPAKEARFQLKEGQGTVRVVARNASWGNFFKGRTTTLEHGFTARLTPPRLEVLTTQHYVNQGGCDMIVYRVTPPSAESGVEVGEAYFKGFPLPGATDPAVRFAIFAYPYDARPGTTPRLTAKDEAANEVVASFNVKLFPKTFRTRTLELDDAFLNKAVPEIMSQTPSLPDEGGVLENYLQINRELRRQNNKQLAELAQRSQPRFLWTEPFEQLGSSQVEASFADHRTYTYRGQEVDRQDHLGYDLATTTHAPVAAANDGVVLLAAFFGIYGNTIVIDHGYGLLSLYGHLASFDVKPGDAVKRGQIIAKSDSTGLAAGDHLHFSIVLQGTQVDAREWWDPHWVEDRLRAKLRQFGGAAAPAAARAAHDGEGPGPASPPNRTPTLRRNGKGGSPPAKTKT